MNQTDQTLICRKLKSLRTTFLKELQPRNTECIWDDWRMKMWNLRMRWRSATKPWKAVKSKGIYRQCCISQSCEFIKLFRGFGITFNSSSRTKIYWETHTNLVLRQCWLKIITPIKRRCSNSRVPFLFLNGRVFDENVFSKITLSNTFHQNLRRTNFTAILTKGFGKLIILN